MGYYSHKKDPIHHYFKEKYDILSASKQALKILKEDPLLPSEARTSVFQKLIKGFDKIPEEPYHESASNPSILVFLGNNRFSFSKKSKVRQEKLKLLQEIQRKKQAEVTDTSNLMMNFLANSKNNDLVVSKDLKKQIDRILYKVNLKKTLNNSSTSFRFATEPSEIRKKLKICEFSLNL